MTRSVLLRLRRCLFPEAEELGWMPIALLGYLGFLFMPVLGWVFPQVDMLRVPFSLAATLASLLVFLPLYFHAFRRGRRGPLVAVLGIYLLALILMRWNPYANTYVIYAVSMLGVLQGRIGARIALMMVMLLIYGLWLYSLWPHPVSIFVWLITALIGAGAFSSYHYQLQRERKQAELKLTQDEVRRIAAFAERERIGRDLHDLLGHSLSMVALKAELAGKLATRDATAAASEMQEVARIARDVLSEVRSAVSGIRSAVLAAELASAKLLLETEGVAIQAAIDEVVLSPEAESALAMTLREAATNVQRHARASQVEVSLRRVGDATELCIADNGRGGKIGPGNGVNGMRERIESLRGDFRIESTSGHGTRVIARLPLEQVA